jgi:hypothetical protein
MDYDRDKLLNSIQDSTSSTERYVSSILDVLVAQVDIMQKHHNLLLELVQDKRYAADNKPDKEEKCA